MDNLKFASNNCNGLSTSSVNRLKIFLYLQYTIKNMGILFLQETHSTKESENEFKKDFGKNNALHFGHGASNSCGVAIGFCGNFEYNVTNEIADPNGRFLLMMVNIGDKEYALINIYNHNVEKDQLKLLQEVEDKIELLGIQPDTNVVLAGDFNFYFDKTLEAIGGNPTTKVQSIARFIKLKEKLDLCDIWRLQHPREKRYTFRQNSRAGKLQRRLDYIFVSNQLQDAVVNTDIRVGICTDHSPVFMELSLEKCIFKRAQDSGNTIHL